MSRQPTRPRSGALLGVGLLMVLCCAVGPALIGAVAASAIGGWLGIAIACTLAIAIAPRRPRAPPQPRRRLLMRLQGLLIAVILAATITA